MKYTEFPPSPILTPFIDCLWTLEINHQSISTERIIPDGKAELIIHYRDRSLEYDPRTKEWQKQGRILFAGQRKGHLLLKPGAKSGMLGVRFKPSGAAQFLKVPVSETTNLILDLNNWSPKCIALLEEQVMEAGTEEARIKVVTNFLEEKLISSRPDFIVNEITNAIYHSYGNVDLRNLVTKFNISERQVERRFATSVGVGPKQLSRIVRFQQVLKQLDEGPTSSLTDVALSHGYFDQSHFNREFKGFTGLSPKAYLAESHQMNDFFI